MPPSNKIWTFHDIEHGNIPFVKDNNNQNSTTKVPQNPTASSFASSANAASAAANVTNGSPVILKCFHIPSLPSSDYAKALLERVVREFEPIAQRRGYNVRSVSEMCCCNDGLDFQPNRKRKLRKMGNNIWGYNQTTTFGGRKSHTIHLRLRHATSHGRFHDYQDVAGTMAHELAHCEHGPHNDKFYKLMDEILDEHAVLMASKLTLGSGRHTMPAFSGQGKVLGTTTRTTTTTTNGTTGLANARQRQQQQQSLGKNQEQPKEYKLGGDSCFTQWMTPAEAAVAAAEARRMQQQMRLRGDRCCRPCTIEIKDDDEEEEDEIPIESIVQKGNNPQKTVEKTGRESKKARRDEVAAIPKYGASDKKLPVNTTKTITATSPHVVDLTLDEEDESNRGRAVSQAPSRNASLAKLPGAHLNKGKQKNTFSSSSLEHWSCHQCTFLNCPIALSCSMCHVERIFS